MDIAYKTIGLNVYLAFAVSIAAGFWVSWLSYRYVESWGQNAARRILKNNRKQVSFSLSGG